MALSAAEKVRVRCALERIAIRKGVPVSWLKSQIDAAMNAIDSRWDAANTQNGINNDIEQAVPGVFTAPQKTYLRAIWLVMRGDREEGAI